MNCPNIRDGTMFSGKICFKMSAKLYTSKVCGKGKNLNICALTLRMTVRSQTDKKNSCYHVISICTVLCIQQFHFQCLHVVCIQGAQITLFVTGQQPKC